MGKKIKCLKCNDIIESTYRHDFVMCSCRSCFVDGGDEYCRIGGYFESMAYVDEDGNERPIIEKKDEQ